MFFFYRCILSLGSFKAFLLELFIIRASQVTTSSDNINFISYKEKKQLTIVLGNHDSQLNFSSSD